MTDREALIVLAAGFANQEYIAAAAVEEAIEALRLIDEHMAAQPTPEPATDETDPLTRYDWAKKTARGEVVDTRTTWPIIRAIIDAPRLVLDARHRVIEAEHHIAILTDQRDRAIAAAEAWRKVSKFVSNS